MANLKEDSKRKGAAAPQEAAKEQAPKSHAPKSQASKEQNRTSQMRSRFKDRYRKTVRPQLQEVFAYANPMQVPELVKIVISMGMAEASKDKNAIQDCLRDLSDLSGQKAILTRAKKAISNFKLREGQPIGAKVTLRNDRMYDFLDRFINVVSARIRDFRGFEVKCDGRGNYTCGLDNQQMFPEIELDKVKRDQGVNITFVTTANTDQEAIELLRLMGFPFKDRPVVVTIPIGE